MVILDKVGEGLANTVDYLVEKNRQMAQLNRLAAIIKTETDMINRAYVALGKQYFAMLQGTAVENDMTQICEVIKFSEERLKKAQTRYDYIKAYGIPDNAVDNVENNYNAENKVDAESAETAPAEKECTECAEEETGDITIASVEEKVETTEEKAAKAVEEIKKKRSGKKDNADAEAAND